ncbi:glutathione S-transferase F8, chloroplastic-like [Vigna radiata var. radiata]|uniref:glutathione transferase n=1 Tax=Vigna radiata var. radiata TaxID=3916 RepID=A0A3Q0F1T9_VIGRR|nr:glutathione S-transferase F8, chloroplastic-like [Vigna radiata var. radiata]
MSLSPFNLKVVGIPTNIDLARVMTCLFEKDVEFRHIPGSIGRRFAVVQEIGKTDFCYESRSTCKYVCEKFSEKGNRELYGRNPLAKKSIEEWMKMEEERFDSPSRILTYYKGLNSFSMRKMSLEELGEMMEIYENTLGKSRYLAGDEFTLADLFHLPHVHGLDNITDTAPLFASPNLSRWWNDISSRHSWMKLLQIRQEYLKRN